MSLLGNMFERGGLVTSENPDEKKSDMLPEGDLSSDVLPKEDVPAELLPEGDAMEEPVLLGDEEKDEEEDDLLTAEAKAIEGAHHQL